MRLEAPAGFGKTTIARMLALTAETHSEVDCSQVSSVLELCRALFVSLAAESPSEPGAFQQIAFGSNPVDWLQALSQTWNHAPEGSLITFENSEHLLSVGDAWSLLTELFAQCPLQRRIVLCSRKRLPLRFGRRILPHEVLNLGKEDLRFSVQEIAQAFSDTSLSSGALERVGEVSQGWPIAVFLLARLAREKHIDHVLDRLEDAAFEDVYSYLSTEALASLSSSENLILQACVAIPNATANDLTRALRGTISATEIPRIAESLPFVTAALDGTFVAHPLLASMLRGRDPTTLDDLLQKAAESWLVSGTEHGRIRAAQLFLSAGNQEAAADAIDCDLAPLFVRTPSQALASIIVALDESVLLRHPKIWSAAGLCRAYTMEPWERLRQARVAWQSLGNHSTEVVRASVFAGLSNALLNVGEFDEAARVREEFRASLVPADDVGTQMMLFFEATASTWLGRDDRIDYWRERIQPLLDGSDATNALFTYDLLARHSRIRGDRAGESRELERALELASRTKIPLIICIVLSDAAFGAWFAGDDALFDHYIDKLESAMDASTRPGVMLLIDCARGRARYARVGCEKLKVRPHAYLIAAAEAVANDERIHFAKEAVRWADVCGQPFVRVLSRVALGMLDSSTRAVQWTEAARIAGMVDSKTLSAAVAALITKSTQPHMLERFVARYSSLQTVDQSQFEIRLLQGTVLCNGLPLKLSVRELTLVLTLALARRPLMWREIASVLWPETSEGSAANLLRVNVTRLRTRLGNKDAIIFGRDGYRLTPRASVDLFVIEDSLRPILSSHQLGKEDREQLLCHFSKLVAAIDLSRHEWDWAERANAKIAEVRRRVADAIMRDSAKRCDSAQVMQIGRELLSLDPCDDLGIEAVIRAHVLNGDRTAAVREYNRYARQLAEELDAEPPTYLFELIAAGESPPRQVTSQAAL